MTEADDILAFEYVLGTAPDRDGIEARIARDPDFAAQVQAWERRLSSLNDGYPDVPAPPLLPGIEARLFGRPQHRRAFFAMGGLLAASVVGLLVVPLWQGAPEDIRMTAPDRSLTVTASVDDGVVRLAQVSGPAAPTGQSYEAWIIRPDSPPVSIGVLQDVIEAAVPDLPDGTVVAISLEPPGGSPTGQPTGPVILSARLKI